MTSQQVDDELQARVRWERTRMLLSHVPLGSLVSAGFAILLVSMVSHLHAGVSTPMLIWLGAILVVALMRTYHALIFRQAANPNRDVWRRGFMVHTALLGACWGLAVWMLPLGDRMDLQSIVTGSVTGWVPLALSCSRRTEERFGSGPCASCCPRWCIAQALALPMGCSVRSAWPDLPGFCGLIPPGRIVAWVSCCACVWRAT